MPFKLKFFSFKRNRKVLYIYIYIYIYIFRFVFVFLPNAKCKMFSVDYHCVKSVQIRSYFWSIQEYSKIRTRNNSVFGHFSRSALFSKCLHKSSQILQIINSDLINVSYPELYKSISLNVSSKRQNLWKSETGSQQLT